MMNNHVPSSWIPADQRPPADEPVVVMYPDGVTDYQLWTGETWFPGRSEVIPVAWIRVLLPGANDVPA